MRSIDFLLNEAGTKHPTFKYPGSILEGGHLGLVPNVFYPFVQIANVNNKTFQIRCKGFLSSFDFLPEVYLWFRHWQYHYSNKRSVKRHTLYTYTVHFSVRTRAQSVRRQHEKRTQEKSEMVICKDTTEVARNI